MIQESVNVTKRAKFLGQILLKRTNAIDYLFKDEPTQVDNATVHSPKLIEEVIAHFQYKENKMVPWNYKCNFVNMETIANIMGIRGMTRNGHCYMPMMTNKTMPKPVEEVLKQKEMEIVQEMTKGE